MIIKINRIYLTTIISIIILSCSINNSSEPENEKPTAVFNYGPEFGTINTVFRFDATGSHDAEDSTSQLSVRWDFNNDGIWDTSFSTEKNITHQYDSIDLYTIKLEVKDTEDLTDFVTKEIEVINESNPDSLIHYGWKYFIDQNYLISILNFEELFNIGDSLAIAYTGIGWSRSRNYELELAKNSFLLGLNINLSLNLKNNILAGLAFTYDALNERENCIETTDSISTNWFFEYDENLDYNDIVIIRAINYYALGDFERSLLEVQKLESSFTVDISTVEGRALLAEKIEELKVIYS